MVCNECLGFQHRWLPGWEGCSRHRHQGRQRHGGVIHGLGNWATSSHFLDKSTWWLQEVVKAATPLLQVRDSRNWIRRFLKKTHLGTFLAVQWWRHCVSTAGDMGSIPGWGTKILHAVWSGQKKKTRKKKKNYQKTCLNPWLFENLQAALPYDYTVEVRNRFKGLDLIDGVPEELWT